MPIGAGFPCHTLCPDESVGPFDFIGPEVAEPVPDPCQAEIGDVPQLLRRAGVTKLVLVHGTFAGNDIAGLARKVARFSPAAGGTLNAIGKQWLDDLVGELGNYAKTFEESLSMLVNPAPLKPLTINRFHWSGENHHLGRADGAMALLDLVADQAATGRVLIFAHSHGGNVLAMMSQLLAADRAIRRRFFAAAKVHFQSPLTGKIDLPSWQRARERLLRSQDAFPRIDVVTFGTPLRYRWNTEICANLLHFVQHRRLDQGHPERAAFPGTFQAIMDAEAGDYVQQLGIAGTDFPPSIFAWRDWIVQRRIQRMFESGGRRRDLLRKLRQGRRVSCDGTTLLVDYPDTDDRWNRKLLGHGVYTCRQWLPFHLREVTNRFYAFSS